MAFRNLLKKICGKIGFKKSLQGYPATHCACQVTEEMGVKILMSLFFLLNTPFITSYTIKSVLPTNRKTHWQRHEESLTTIGQKMPRYNPKDVSISSRDSPKQKWGKNTFPETNLSDCNIYSLKAAAFNDRIDEVSSRVQEETVLTTMVLPLWGSIYFVDLCKAFYFSYY